MPAIVQNDIFYGTVPTVGNIDDTKTTKENTWSADKLNTDLTAIDSNLRNKKRITATTNANGVIGIGTVGLSIDYVIKSIVNVSNPGNVYFIPYNNPTGWGITVWSPDNFSHLTNTEITIDIYYERKIS